MATPLETLKRLRRKYPASGLSKVQLGELLNETAWVHRHEGYGLLGKPAGNNCPQPRTGKKVSVDYLVHGPTKRGWDCLIDAGGASTPTWSGPEDFTEEFASGSRSFVPPVEPIGAAPPPPDPPPPPPPDPPPPDFDIENRVLLLERIVEDLEDRLVAEEKKPLPDYQASVFGYTITSKPVQ